ncbi:hypothetical protein Zmor_026400 [Zophobas morio]|uniref:Mutator-like transposase domain-containing protein n=1 Tax=Zophobas morio TaxID=2755281 RepID=A0AA38M5C2_9CUCU|nr:hypothetical protein Zmor_026400 [Zophobas morio]
MEADIIVEGFKQSIPMYGVKYTRFIGDGDSSVLDHLRKARPYGLDTVLQKLECANHICRNFNNKIKELIKKTRNNVGPVPVTIRKILQNNLSRLRISIYTATY